MRLSEAILSKLAYTTHGGHAVYSKPALDEEWNIASVMHGAIILQACVQRQSATSHPDPCHVSAQYLAATTGGKQTDIRVKVIKRGRQFTSITCKLIQEGKTNVRAEVLMTKLPEKPDPTHELSLFPPKSGAKRIPALSTPQQAKPMKLYSKMMFKAQCTWSQDMNLKKRNDEKRKTLAEKSRKTLDHNGVLEWASYIDLVNEDKGWNSAMLGFGVDMFENTPDLIGYHKPAWYPTMSLSMHIFAKPQPNNPDFSRTKVLAYASGAFLYSGVHDATVEIWTAPSDEAAKSEDWRDRMICLARGTQMALWMPLSVNEGMMKAKAAKAKL